MSIGNRLLITFDAINSRTSSGRRRGPIVFQADAAQLVESPQVDESPILHRPEMQADIDVGAAGDRRWALCRPRAATAPR